MFHLKLAVACLCGLLFSTKVNCTQVLCITDTAFTIITEIFNNQVDIGVRLYCPLGHRCVSNTDTPCVANYLPPPPTTRPPITTTTKKPNESTEPSSGDINCDGPGYHPAAKCEEYYECAPLYWWFKAVLRTCKEGYFFSQVNKPCSMPPNVVCAN